MFNVRKKLVTCLVLVAFMFCLASPVYANTEEYTGAVIESGHYTENSVEYEYVISVKGNADILTTIYTMDEGNRVLYDQFITSRIGNVVYIDGEPVAYVDGDSAKSNNNYENETTASLEPQVSYYADNITALRELFIKGKFAVASVLASFLIKGELASIAAGALLTVAEEIININIDQIHFEQYIIREYFPEDDFMVALRETVKVGYYTSVSLTNMIGDWVVAVEERGVI